MIVFDPRLYAFSFILWFGIIVLVRSFCMGTVFFLVVAIGLVSLAVAVLYVAQPTDFNDFSGEQ